jgi:alpha-beta hydrolase superfamily lysophospholipase
VKSNPWIISTVSSISILGLAATTGLVLLAHHFVDELSRPHQLVDDQFFQWQVPPPMPEPPPSQQRSLMFHGPHGPLLRGEFWAQQHSAPTVVICHGYRVSRSQLRSVAALEYAFGYNTLLFDFRGHGESESVATSGGNAEVHDLRTAITVASQQAETLPGKIILHGFSMGASIALLSLPHPDVAAVIVDSPYSRLDEILRHIVHWHLTNESNSWQPAWHPLRDLFPAIAWFTVEVSKVVFRLRFGHALIARPESFRQWKAKKRTKGIMQHPYPPILLIHGMNDELIPLSHAHRLVAAARAKKIPLETYFVEGAGHCEAYGYNPERYIEVLQGFASRQLESDQPAMP